MYYIKIYNKISTNDIYDKPIHLTPIIYTAIPNMKLQNCKYFYMGKRRKNTSLTNINIIILQAEDKLSNYVTPITP